MADVFTNPTTLGGKWEGSDVRMFYSPNAGAATGGEIGMAQAVNASATAVTRRHSGIGEGDTSYEFIVRGATRCSANLEHCVIFHTAAGKKFMEDMADCTYPTITLEAFNVECERTVTVRLVNCSMESHNLAVLGGASQISFKQNTALTCSSIEID